MVEKPKLYLGSMSQHLKQSQQAAVTLERQAETFVKKMKAKGRTVERIHDEIIVIRKGKEL